MNCLNCFYNNKNRCIKFEEKLLHLKGEALELWCIVKDAFTCGFWRAK